MDDPQDEVGEGPRDDRHAGPLDELVASAAAVGPRKRARRCITVSDIDRMQRDMVQLETWRTLLPEMQAKIASLEEELTAARTSVNGLHALQEAVKQDEFTLGKALQVSLRSRLLEKTRLCPPVRRSVGHRPKTTMVVEVQAVLRAVIQFVAMTKMVCTHHRKQALSVRTIKLESRDSMNHAFGMTPSVVAAVQSRVFKRKDGSKTARILLEHYTTDEGKILYVVSRSGGTAAVASRASEEYDPRRKRFVHPLVKSTLPIAELPEDLHSPVAEMVWKESRSSKLQLEDLGDLVSGKFCVTVPISIVQGTGEDVGALID